MFEHYKPLRATSTMAAKGISMGKKSTGRHGAKPEFRESDFAGRPPQEQAKLSGSLNQLSQEIASSRKLLREMETGPTVERIQLSVETPKEESTGTS